MKKLGLLIFVLAAGLYMVGCSSDIDYDGSQDLSNLDTTTVNEKAQDTTGIELLISDKYLRFTKKEQRLLYHTSKNAMLAINPIFLPESDNPALPQGDSLINDSFKNPQFTIASRLTDVSDANYFFGYTTTCAINDSAVVILGEKRRNEKYVNDFSDNFIITQKVTTGKYVYNNVFRYAPYGTQFVYDTRPAVGSNGKDTIVAKVQTGLMVGVYDAAQDTVKWTHYPKAFEDLNQMNKEYVHYSSLDVPESQELGDTGRFTPLAVAQTPPPTICYHPVFGFLMFTGSQIDNATKKPGLVLRIDPKEGTVKPVLKNWAPLTTKDGVKMENIGSFNEVITYTVTEEFASEELPAGSILLVGLSRDKIYQTYYKYEEGDRIEDLKFNTAYQANTSTSETKSNPVSLIINPYTKKIEMIKSTPYDMHLFTMSVKHFCSDTLSLIGRKPWETVTKLIDRDLSVRGYGLYPVGSVINKNRDVYSHFMASLGVKQEFEGSMRPGVQRIVFCAADEYPARCGVFEMVRALDTDVAGPWLKFKRDEVEAQSY